MMEKESNSDCAKMDNGWIEQHGEAMGVEKDIQSGKASKQANMVVNAKEVKFVCQGMDPVSWFMLEVGDHVNSGEELNWQRSC